jgi:hypothetical protein
MTKATIQVEELIRNLKFMVEDGSEFGEHTPDISCEGDYREEVEKLADKVLNEYDQERELSREVGDAVHSSELLSGSMWKYPIMYNYSGTCRAKNYMENSLGPIEGLASACLRGDVKEEVEKRREASEDETPEGGSYE